jgi:hypothetical protein
VRRTWPQRLAITSSCVLIAVCVAAAGGLVYAYSKVSKIARVDLGTSLTGPTAAATHTAISTQLEVIASRCGQVRLTRREGRARG